MIGLSLLLLLAQSQPIPNPPRLYVYYALPGAAVWTYKSLAIDPPLSLSIDAAGQARLSGYVVTGPGGPPGPRGSDATYAFAEGFIRTALAPYPDQIHLDTSFVSYRTAPPAGPGPCGPSAVIPGGVSATTGTAAWAADAAALYVCVQTVPGGAGTDATWAWMRIPGLTSW